MLRRGDHELVMKTSEGIDSNKTVSSQGNTRFLTGKPLGNDCADNSSEITLTGAMLTKNLTVTPSTDIGDGNVYSYKIFGNIVDQGVSPIEDVNIVVTITDGGVAVDTVTTDANGDYALYFMYNESYTITPAKATYNFTAKEITVADGNEEHDFVDIENYSFTKRRTITLESASVATELTNYPAYIYIDDLDKANLRSDGQDIMFFLSDDTTRLPLEIELYIDSGATGVLHAWVKIPTLATSPDTVLYMYYNDADYTQPPRNKAYGSESVWNDNYIGVWHMGNDPDSSHIKDSTSNAWVGTKSSSNSGPAQTDGKIAYAQDYASGPVDRIDIPHDAGLLASEVTVSCIFKRNGGSDAYMIGMDAVGYSNYELRMAAAKLAFKGRDTEATTIIFTGDTTLSIGTYYYIQGVYGNDEGAVHKLYVNKNVESLTESGGGGDNGSLSLSGASQLTLGYASVMELEEVRISSVRLSKAQHDTEHDNLLNVGSFLTIGAETSDAKASA